MKFLFLFVLLIPSIAFTQTNEKHPRVTEVEEKLRDEASRYFTRRFPGDAFFVRVEVNPLRRISNNDPKSESLPYFDTVSEEDLDEWDDPTTPLSFLRHRVTKVSLELSVPEKFSDEKISNIKNELQIYLKLLPFRDEIRIDRRLKENDESILPPYFYALSGGLLVCFTLLGLILKMNLGARKESATPQAAKTFEAPAATQAKEQSRPGQRGPTDVRGDVTFNDPLKIMDIISIKLSIIEKSGTFPTLRDLMTLDQSVSLSSVLHIFPDKVQTELFSYSSGNRWLEAFADTNPVTHETLLTLDRLSRERSFSAKDRIWENVLIQVWRLGDRSVSFFKKLDQNEAFFILQQLPKSISLVIAKKAFPGAWARILDRNEVKLAIGDDSAKTWLKELQLLLPPSEWKILLSYRKDRELLSYLDHATIEEEKEIYESLDEDSFVFQVRPPFYKIFELGKDEFTQVIAKFSVDRWALSVVNSSRVYIKTVAEALDDKKKLVFSSHLKALDHRVNTQDQSLCRRDMANEVASYLKVNAKEADVSVENFDHAKTA